MIRFRAPSPGALILETHLQCNWRCSSSTVRPLPLHLNRTMAEQGASTVVMIDLSFQRELYSPPSTNPSRFVHEIEGSIIAYGRTDESSRVGTFKVYEVDLVAAISQGVWVKDAFDARTRGAYEAVFFSWRDGRQGPSRALYVVGGKLVQNPSPLLIERLSVAPEYRGQGIGLATVCALLRRFSAGVGWAALNLSPEAGAGDLAPPSLRRYFSALGFSHYSGTGYVVRTMEELPEPEAYLGKVQRIGTSHVRTQSVE